ncbi:MAG: AAA family ATPase [Pseudomonadota bacterium]
MTAASTAPLQWNPEEFDTLPDAMRNARRWMVWKLVENTDPSKKGRKVPHYANGAHRETTDTAADLRQLATLDEAIAACQGGAYTGLGFALGPDWSGSYWQGVDFDGLSSRQNLAYLAEELPGYTETSPSGDGVHAIGYGRAFETLGSNSSGIEAYCRGRFFTVTADNSGIHPPVCLADFVESRLRPLHRPAGLETSLTVPSGVKVSPEVVRDLRSALWALRADDRALWVDVGHALKELGDVGRGLWMEWSSQSESHDPLTDARTWDSFKPTAIHYQSVFHKAQERGWANTGTSTPAGLPKTEAAEPIEVTVGDVFDAEPPAPEFVIDQIVPAGVVTLLGANGGTGKSMLALIAAVCVAMGLPFMGRPTRQGHALFYSAEDASGVLRYRLSRICRHLGVDPQEVQEQLTILDLTDTDPALFCEVSTGGVKSGAPTAAYDKLSRYVEDREVDFLIIDNASDTYDANEIERARVRGFIRSLAQLVKQRNGAVLLLAHVDKSTARGVAAGQGYSGSTAWNNSVRSRLFMSEKNGGVQMEHEKSNFGPKADPMQLQWTADGVLAAAGAMPEIDGINQQIDDRNKLLILSMIDELYMRAEYIAPASNSPVNAYKMLQGEKKMPAKICRSTMVTLLRESEREGLLIKEEYPGPNRHIKQRWAITEAGKLRIALSASSALSATT